MFISLKSSEGDIFTVYVQVARCSEVIKTMLDICGSGMHSEDDADDYGNVILPLPNVDSATLKLLIDWMSHHFFYDEPWIKPKNAQPELPHEPFHIPPWDKEFLKIDRESLFKLLQASNYLEISALRTVVSKTIANKLRGKTLEEVMKNFNIPQSSSE
ncbi:S-phase kinase-associated protein 1-like [Harmonia axyridis]|uniref:S-phase kinase-associated protein 1-like n=1 Tax=Harmonia axyridis TaxID=115357 RepID=UPI001E276174|nr:S-phase kinase-associated protein 1-like [Harmonia axyridis]